MKRFAVLYASKKSVWKTFPEADVYDEDRDARTFPGGLPVIAHPPCRLWCRMAALSKALASEKFCFWHALAMVRENGGILEHPRFSKAFVQARLVRECVTVNQADFGGRIYKPTWLWSPNVALPLVLERQGRDGLVAWDKESTRRDRTATPESFARWLRDLVLQNCC